MQSAQMLLHSGALTPTGCCCCRLTVFPAASTEVPLQGCCNSRPHYFTIRVELRWPGDLCPSVSLSQQGHALPSSVCWMQAGEQVLADDLHHLITQLFHSVRRILVSPVTSVRGVISASVLSNTAVGGHEQHDYTAVTAVVLYGPIFLFILFILYLSAHDGFGFASRLHRAIYCFCRDLCTFPISQPYASTCQIPACQRARQATSTSTMAAKK